MEMPVDLMPLFYEYLKDEYTEGEIKKMLAEAAIERDENNVKITYKNGVIEYLKILFRPYLIQESFTTPWPERLQD